MPYIKKTDRIKFKDTLPEVIGLLKNDEYDGQILPQRRGEIKVGEVNYVISTIIWELFKTNPSYTLGNNLVGVLECVKQEFIRRKLNPYEDEKIAENGDI